jgi:hypothetical protein
MLFKLIGSSYSRIVIISGVNSILTFLLNIIIPINLGLGFYGDYKYITTIISFSGLFHLGYLDGFYINSLIDSPKPKLSVTYLLVLVIFAFFLCTPIIFFIGYDSFFSILAILCLLIIATFINAFSIINYIDGKFLYPILIQTSSTLLFLITLNFHFTSQFFSNHSYSLIIISNLIQLLLLLFFTNRIIGLNIITIKFNSVLSIKKLHTKGFKILSVGLLGILFLTIDKVVLRFFLSENLYGLFCISNSSLLFLLGLSMSVVNKLIKDFSGIDESPKNPLYNSITRKISFFSCLLIFFSFLIGFYFTQYFPVYKYQIDYLKVTMLTFPYLFIILVLYANLSKIYNFEKYYLIFFSIVASVQALVFIFYNDKLILMQFLASILLLLSIFIFHFFATKYRLINKTINLNRVEMCSPLVLYMILHYFCNY